MLEQINCAPNLDLPQKVDIDSIRNEAKQEADASKQIAKQETSDNDSDNDAKKPGSFNILPLHSPPNALLRKQLSLRHNAYLAYKFDKFLNDKPKNMVQVRLYHEIASKRDMPKTRRMKLNGKFYDVDNKLAPIPFIPDPRRYCKHMNCKKVNQPNQQL